LAGPHLVIEGAEGCLDGRVALPEVHPVQVDVVRLQAAQGFLAGPEDILAARAAGVGVAGAHVGEKLGGDHHLVALYRVAADMVADDFLRVSSTVAVGGVDEVAAQFPVAVHHPIAFPGANADAPVLAEGHGAEAQGADTQAGAAEGNVVVEGHRGFLQRCSWGLAPTAREGLVPAARARSSVAPIAGAEKGRRRAGGYDNGRGCLPLSSPADSGVFLQIMTNPLVGDPPRQAGDTAPRVD